VVGFVGTGITVVVAAVVVVVVIGFAGVVADGPPAPIGVLTGGVMVIGVLVPVAVEPLAVTPVFVLMVVPDWVAQ
jgi:hypothetical protein